MILYMDLYSTTEQPHSVVHLFTPFSVSSAKLNTEIGVYFFWGSYPIPDTFRRANQKYLTHSSSLVSIGQFRQSTDLTKSSESNSD